MAEAQPSNKVGGHAYGRRNQAISNTAEEGELCLYTGHSLGRYSSHSMRYDSQSVHRPLTRSLFISFNEIRQSPSLHSLCT